MVKPTVTESVLYNETFRFKHVPSTFWDLFGFDRPKETFASSQSLATFGTVASKFIFRKENFFLKRAQSSKIYFTL